MNIQPEALYQVKGQLLIDILSEGAAISARVGFNTAKELIEREKPEEWLRRPEALKLMKKSAPILQGMKVPDGDKVSGKIRYRVFARNDHRYSRKDILAWIETKATKYSLKKAAA